MPLDRTGVKLVSVPPTTSTSAWLKVVLVSLSVKVIWSLPPAVKTPVPLRAMAITGEVVSAGMVLKDKLTWLSDSTTWLTTVSALAL